MKTGLVNLSLFLLTCAVMLGSCSSDDPSDGFAGHQFSEITFTPMEVSSSAITRGSQTTASTLQAYGVSCSAYSSDATYTTSSFGSYFYDKRIDAFSGSSGYFWPGSRYKLSFFAYAPYGNTALTVSDRGTTGSPVYSYTVPESVQEQIDFITAEVTDRSGESDGNPVTLAFSHNCADIRIAIYNKGFSDITVNSVSLSGLKYSGSFTDGAWTLGEEVNSDLSHPFLFASSTGVASEATVDYTGTGNHFIMLPQMVSSGTDFMTVSATVEGEAKTYTYTLDSDFSLAAGKSYNLTISLGAESITVDMLSDIEDWGLDTNYIVIGGVSADGIFTQPSVSGNGKSGVEDWTQE